VKRKLPAGVKSELRKRLQTEVDLAVLTGDIADFLDKPAGKLARGKDFANILAAYLAQKQLICAQQTPPDGSDQSGTIARSSG